MVRHDHPHPLRVGGAHRLDGSGSTVAGDDQGGSRCPRLCESSFPEVVAIADPMRDKGHYVRPRLPKHPREQGRGTLPVNIVVTMHENRATGADGGRNLSDCFGHVLERHGVTQRLQRWPKKANCVRWGVVPALNEQRSKGLGDIEGARQFCQLRWIGHWRNLPTGLDENHSSTS